MDVFVKDVIEFVNTAEGVTNVSHWCENNTPDLADIYEKHSFANSHLYASHLMYFIHVIGKMDVDIFNMLITEYAECQYVDYFNASCV